MKAFLIARVSTDNQADALPGQVYRLKDYAEKMRYDYDLFEIKESAYKGDRVQFNEVLSRVFTVEETLHWSLIKLIVTLVTLALVRCVRSIP